MLVLQRSARQLAIVPIVALASYFLMAALPMPTDAESKRAERRELVASYREDLGLGQPLGFLRPWQKLFNGERLGTSAQGVTGDELLLKLLGSVTVGAFALALALLWALLFASFRASSTRRDTATDVISAAAFGTPVFIPALLFAPYVVEAGHLLPELAAAFVISIWPGVFLGTLIADAMKAEARRDYVRTAKGKGVAPGHVWWRHLVPNVVPALLDALPPVATALLAGSFAAERVFNLPYFGQLYVLAVLQKQLPVVVVATTLFASVLVVVRLLVEWARLFADPRSREERAP
jgi:oligopeptide transport system permease protein